MVLNPTLLQTVLDASPEGVVICDARSKDLPAVYANAAMQQLTGYAQDEIVGRNLRFLQGTDRDQPDLERIRASLREGIACRGLLRNYRKDGELFWNELRIAPIRDAAGQLTHFAGFHRQGYERLRSDSPGAAEPMLNTQTMLAYVRDDKLTGLLKRSYFEDLLKREWGIAQRETRPISMLMFSIDFIGPYRDVFGAAGAEQTFRRVAKVVNSCFRRASDLCARWGDDDIVALTMGMDDEAAKKFGDMIVARVRDLAIHHPRSTVSRFLTISAGVASLMPAHEATPNQLIDTAIAALKKAHDTGHNRVCVADR